MKIGIYGYGNLGRGAALAALGENDVQLVGIFTRRDPAAIEAPAGVPVFPAAKVTDFAGEIDVLLNCGGSKTDLPESTPRLARYFNLVDSFDTHALLPAHIAKTHAAAKETGHVALVAAGWDPGLFSLFRAYACGLFPAANVATFWGPGVSQGHTQAVKRIPGVADAVQFTVPDKERLRAFQAAGTAPSPEASHRRVCWVVAPQEQQDRIRREIGSMPQYFSGYRTEVNFVSQKELERKKTAAHGGNVLAALVTGKNSETRHLAQFRLSLGSNPEFTGAVLVGFARAVHAMALNGDAGAKTVFDIPPALLFTESAPADILRFL